METIVLIHDFLSKYAVWCFILFSVLLLILLCLKKFKMFYCSAFLFLLLIFFILGDGIFPSFRELLHSDSEEKNWLIEETKKIDDQQYWQKKEYLDIIEKEQK